MHLAGPNKLFVSVLTPKEPNDGLSNLLTFILVLTLFDEGSLSKLLY